MVKRRRDKRIWLVILGVFVAVFLFAFLAQRSRKVNEDVSAASLANFDPGYIISDYQMGNYNSMSEAEIQAFLTAKNPCSNTDYNYYKSLMAQYNGRVTWHWANGHFVCLSEEKFGDGETIGSGETAAHIIWQAAQDYKINPQVLIALLQKEQGLITDPIPNSVDYRSATGYGCPDTAACSSKYYGFKNQVRNAASLFRTVLNGGWTNYPLGENYIQYSPTASCGGSVVNVRNLATSALYRYTPYQPNAGALAAGYGTAYCGAYGNRNFYLYFQDWFGGITREQRKIVSSNNIVEDEYVLYSSINRDFVLDVADGKTENGTNVYVYDKNKAAAPKWKIKNNRDGTYTIINVITNKVLDVESGGKQKGVNVQSYASNSTCAQKWKIEKNSDDTVSFYSACSELALDVSGGNAENATNVQIYTLNDTAAQRWVMVPTRKLNDGQYVINSQLGAKWVVDISGGVKNAKNTTNIQVYQFNGTDAQEWEVKYDSDGYYTIKNPTTGKVLDAENAGTTNGTNVHLYSSNKTCAQKWQIVRNNDSSYNIFSKCSGKVIDVKDGKAFNGANLQLYSTNGTDAQKWKFETINKDEIVGKYIIKSALSSKMVIDISGGVGAAKNSTNIQIYGSNGTDAQKWEIDKNDDGTYTIKNPTTGKVLDAENAGTTNGTNVHLYSSNKTCAQKWQILANLNNTYTFISKCSNKVLDVAGGNSKNGTNIQLYELNSSKAQQWILEKY